MTSYFSVSKFARVNLLDQLQLLGMGQAAVGEPEVLVEPPGIDDQAVALPFSHRSAVIERVIVVAADLPGWLRPSR